MKRIPLTKGKVAIVDDEDYDELMKHKWHFNSSGYAQRSIRGPRKYTQRPLPMHQAIMGRRPGLQNDHINRDRLDNRRCNLRFLTDLQNRHNRSQQKNATSPYMGAYLDKRTGRWRAIIGFRGKPISLGFYATAKEASHAYEEAKKIYHPLPPTEVPKCVVQ